MDKPVWEKEKRIKFHCKAMRRTTWTRIQGKTIMSVFIEEEVIRILGKTICLPSLKWVSDCCLKPNQQFFLAIPWQEQVNFQWDDYDVHFVLHEHA